jgi:hypothetical protein
MSIQIRVFGYSCFELILSDGQIIHMEVNLPKLLRESLYQFILIYTLNSINIYQLLTFLDEKILL